MHIAATLINVEDRLDRDLIGLIVPKAQAEAVPTAPADADFQQVQAAVLRECSVNLVRVKEAIASNVAGTLDVSGARCVAGPDPGHQGRTADARQDARRRDRRRHREASQGPAAAGRHRRPA